MVLKYKINLLNLVSALLVAPLQGLRTNLHDALVPLWVYIIHVFNPATYTLHEVVFLFSKFNSFGLRKHFVCKVRCLHFSAQMRKTQVRQVEDQLLSKWR